MTKETIFKLSAAFILFVLLTLGLYAFITKSKSNNLKENNIEIPQITENYTSTTLTKYVEFDNRIKNINNKFVVINNDEEYYINYENDSLQYKKTNEIKINKNYTIQTNEKTNQVYILNNTNNTMSDLYDSITEITFDNQTYSYLLVQTNNKYSLINLENDELIELDDNITYIEDPYEYNDGIKEIRSTKYIKVENNNKYGIIDYNGNIILDIKYDYIKIVNDKFIVKLNSDYGVINSSSEEIIKTIYQNITDYKDYFVVKKDTKYGILNQNEEQIFKFEIDYIEKVDDYLIVIKNNRLGIFKDNDLVIDYQIETQNNQIYAYMHNDNLHINTYVNNKIRTYVINDDKIKKTIYNELREISISDYKIDDAQTDILDDYTYSTNIKNNILTLTVYDNAYDRYYEHNIDLDFNTTKYIIYPKLTKNYSNNYYKIIIDIENKSDSSDTKNIITYYDLNKRVVIQEKEAISKYLDNGYQFAVNDNHELKVYKNDELISTHKDIEYHIGGYYFSNTNGTIYKLKFKNESNN